MMRAIKTKSYNPIGFGNVQEGDILVNFGWEDILYMIKKTNKFISIVHKDDEGDHHINVYKNKKRATFHDQVYLKEGSLTDKKFQRIKRQYLTN